MDESQLGQVTSYNFLDKLLNDTIKNKNPELKETQLNLNQQGTDKLSKLLDNKKLMIKPIFLYKIEDKLRHYQSIMIKHKIFSNHQQPLIFNRKELIHLVITLTKELNGTIIRSDKAIKQLKGLGFTLSDKVIIISVKKK